VGGAVTRWVERACRHIPAQVGRPQVGFARREQVVALAARYFIPAIYTSVT
jgi:hypothetical protein